MGAWTEMIDDARASSRGRARLAGAVLAMATALACGPSLGACGLPGGGEDLGALALADRASECLAQKRMGEAGRLFYAHAARARALAKMDRSASGWESSARQVQSQVGAPANRWLGGDVDGWIEAVEWALAWDKSAPWSEGGREAAKMGLGMAELAKARAESRRGMAKLADDLAGMDRGKLAKQRERAGLENRAAKAKAG